MKNNAKAVVIYIALIVGAIWLWRAGTLRSDDEMMAHFAAHRVEFEKVVQMYQEDGQDMWISADGRTWPENLQSSRGIDSGRAGKYRSLVNGLGVNGVIGGPEAVEFQTYPILSPLGPMKAYWYSTQAPNLVTGSDTQEYEFAKGQWRRVCRPIEANWYICLDYED